MTTGKKAWFGVGAITIVHALGLVLLFQPISGLWSADPIIEQDWGLHYHHLRSFAAFWADGHRTWGYNPYFMAGYPSNTIQDLSIKLYEFVAVLLPFDQVRSFKIVVFLATASIPWMLFFTARNFFLDELNSTNIGFFATLLGTAYWWNSFPREMFFYGMVGFSVAVYFSLLVLSLLFRIPNSQSPTGFVYAGWIISLSLLLPLHIQSFLVLALPSIALLIMRRKFLGFSKLFWITTGLSSCLLINLIWLVPLYTHLSDSVPQRLVEEFPVFSSPDPLTVVKDYFTPIRYFTFREAVWEKGLRLSLLIIGGIGLIHLKRARRSTLLAMLLSGIVPMFILTYFGSLIPATNSLQPFRFKIAFDLFLLLPASFALAQSRPSSFWPRLLLLLGSLPFVLNLIDTESRREMTLRTIPTPRITDIVSYAQSSVDLPTGQGRLLFEESGDESGFVYEGMYLSAFLPYWADREVIGGPSNLYNDRHHFAEFHSGLLFKQKIETIGDEMLREYLRIYNIQEIITFNPRSQERLLRRRDGLISLHARIGTIAVLRVNQRMNWFLEGDGLVQARMNSLVCSNVSGKTIILSYHWIEGLTSTPPVRIEAVHLLDDPIPFIKIIDPPAEFELRVGSP